MKPMTRTERVAKLKELARERILVFDGSWGVLIQNKGLVEEDYRGDRFTAFAGQMKGNNDILNVTRPDIIEDIHNAYFGAGADISETNTFCSTTIAQDDYELDAQSVYDLNYEGAKIGRRIADEWTAKEPDKPRFLAGAMGPLNKMLSMSPDVNDPGARAVTFDEVYQTYRHQVKALYEGGVDMYVIETITDTLNCKAAIKAIRDLEAEGQEELPIWISGTITDRSGRTLSGQTVSAFWNSIRHGRPFAVGFNCALGAELMRPHVADLARQADCFVSAHPNAGLPNEMGSYDETPEQTAAHIGNWARDGLLNIVGGWCGETPAHIEAIAKAVEGVKPRQPAEAKHTLRLSGLEPFEVA